MLTELLKRSPSLFSLYINCRLCIGRTYFYLKNKYISRKESYAQHGDDITIKKLMGDVKTFVDIGAYDGVTVSNTFLFSLSGASGICFEPNTYYYRWLKYLYLINRNVRCFNVGISTENREAYIINAGPKSYLPESSYAWVKRDRHFGNENMSKVRLVRFDEIMGKISFPTQIDLLSIDVEGHELSVLKSIDFNKYSFKCIVIETENGTHKDIEEIEAVLNYYDYKLAYKNILNSFYLKA